MHHTVDAMASDYLRIIELAVARPAPPIDDLPAHFKKDYAELAIQLARQFGVDVDVLASGS